MFPRFRSSVIFLAIIALLTGVSLFAYGQWSEPTAQGHAALRAGDEEVALQAYATAVQRFKTVSTTQHFLASDFAHVAHNQLAILYRLGRYDELLDVAASAPPAAAPHFWAGCAFFKKGTLEKKPQAQVEWLTRAEGEFKLALGMAPDDWDTKFNYELSARLLAALRPGTKSGTAQKTVPSTLMQLLRPQQQNQQQQQRPVKKIG